MSEQRVYACFIRTLRIEHRKYGKVYKAVVGFGMPLQARALKGMFRTATQAADYGRRAAVKMSGLLRRQPHRAAPTNENGRSGG